MTRDIWTRRSLMTGVGATVAALGVGFASTRAQTSGGGFQPARHSEDEWFNELPGQHRVFIDSGTATGGAEAVLYANNLYQANQSAYAIEPADLAIIVCFRHFSTVFGYNDAMWAKYGEQLSAVASFTDPNTGTHPTSNLMDSADYGMALPNLGNTISAQVERGTRFAICNAATRFMAGAIAEATGGSADEVYEELVANAIPNSRFVSAGVVAATRAQEYGYSLLYAG